MATSSKVNLLVKEIELTKLLASNDPKTRSDGIKQIKQLLLQNSGDTTDAFHLDDYLIIWRGLFYFMWMSDKPLPQESATEKISNLFHSCTSHQGKILFLEAFFLTIKDDWMSISQHRIDKFMMLVRRCLRQVLFTFVNCDWDVVYMEMFNPVLYRALKSFTLSLRTHIQEIFLEELAKVSNGKVPSEALIIILDAFLHYISELHDFILIKEVTQNVFKHLLTQSTEMEMLEAKFEAWRKMGKPGKSYNDLELVEGDIADDNSNEQNDRPMDPRAGNVSIEIPRIKFNAKDVANILNKYLTEVDCTKKCLIELTKLLRWYNRLGEGVLPYKPQDLKLNSQILKKKRKNKKLAKMVKVGVKKLEMIDSKIKKNSREDIDDHKSLKKLESMGEIIVEHGKIGKSIWKVRKFDECDSLKENFSINGSWTVSDETKNNDEANTTVFVTDNVNKTLCVTDDEPPLLVPAGFNVEASETSENTPTSIKSLTNRSPKSSNSKKKKSPKSNIVNESHVVNTSSNKSWSVSDNNCESASKKVKNTTTPDNTTKSVKNVTPNNKNKKITPLKGKSPETNIHQSPGNDLVMSKIQRRSDEITINSSLNESWTICDDKLNLSKRKSPKSNTSIILNKNDIQKLNSPSITKYTPNISININTSLKNSPSVSINNDGSTSQKVKRSIESVGTEKSTLITPEKNSKSPKSPKSPTPEQRVLRRRTILIPKKKPEGPNEGTPKRKVKDTSETKTLPKRRKTIGNNEINAISKPEETSVLKLEEISNKVIEKVRGEAFEDGFDSPRKSSRLSIKIDSAKKRVQIQLQNNVAQDFVDYRTTLVTNPENPHDASKLPVQGVLKSTPEVNRINPFYKFAERSAKKNSRKSMI